MIKAKRSSAWTLATWFGCGLSPIAPGTVGSLGALVVARGACYFLHLNGPTVAAAGLALYVPAVWAAGWVARETGRKDPGFIVIDEVVGQWITFLGAPNLNGWTWIGAFLLFRLFDIVKPFPSRESESLPGGLGIVTDDAIAGLYAALVLFMIGRMYFY